MNDQRSVKEDTRLENNWGNVLMPIRPFNMVRGITSVHQCRRAENVSSTEEMGIPVLLELLSHSVAMHVIDELVQI